MATYKVIQDIEADDKFLGPLTIKQFVFGVGGLFFGYLNVFAIQRGFPYAMLIFTPPMLLGIFLAVPWSKDQPTEVWVLAKLRFYFKPRIRKWDQSGMEELVTITAPKKEEKPLTDNLSQTEVKSRLEVLGDLIDSRGWAIKEAQMANLVHPSDTGDRLISPTTMPQEVPIVDLATIPDVYDTPTSTTENVDRMIEQSSDLRKNQSLEIMDRVRHGEPLDSVVSPSVNFTPPKTDYQTFTSKLSDDEKMLLNELKSRKAPDALINARMKVIQPLDPRHAITPVAREPITDDRENIDDLSVKNRSTKKPKSKDMDNTKDLRQETIPPPANPAILELANNNDLDVATIARTAKREVDDNPDEVVLTIQH